MPLDQIDDQTQLEEKELEQQSSMPDAGAPLQNFFTLPFALHLRPLPHVSFLAQQGSTDSSEGDFNDGASVSSEGSNYRAGRYHLKPIVQSVPPHSLSTISILLERTDCLEAVPIWSRLLTLLENADNDPHFANLRKFFDARFDSNGTLIQDGIEKGEGDPEDEKDKTIFKGGSTLFKKRTDSIARRSSQSKTNSPSLSVGGEEWSRQGNHTRLTSRALSKSRLGLSLSPEDQAALEEEDGSAGEDVRSQRSGKSRRRSIQQDVMMAPEIYCSRPSAPMNGNNGAERREAPSSFKPVRFRVRLDLHKVKLAPPPPRTPMAFHRASMRSRPNQQNRRNRPQEAGMASSPDHRNRDVEGLRRVTSLGASSERSYVGGQSLQSITSPGSVLSQQFSEESHSDEVQGGGRNRARRRRAESDALSASPPSKRYPNKQQSSSFGQFQAARTMTESSAGTNLASDYATSPDMDANSIGSFSKNEGKRRPSIIQRFMGLAGRKAASNRRPSATSNWSYKSTEDSQNTPGQVVKTHDGAVDMTRKHSGQASLPPLQTTTPALAIPAGLVSSPITMESINSRSLAMMTQGQEGVESTNARRMRETSEWSNEEALDVADDEGSVESSPGWGKFSKRRASSSGALPSNLSNSTGAVGVKMESDLRPVDEDKVFDGVSVFSGNQYDDGDIKEEDEEGEEGGHRWKHGADFLSLFRLAAHTTLHLKNKRTQYSSDGDLRTPRSSSTIGDLQTPTGSFQMEEKLKAESLLAPFLQKGQEENTESWWLCGSADPLPISFTCALSQSLGWKGMMHLCYGKGSRSDKSRIFASLGKAAELDAKLKDESSRVRSWAQAVSTDDPNRPFSEENAEGDLIDEDGAISEVTEDKIDHTDGDETLVVGSPPTFEENLEPSESAVANSETDTRAKETKLAKWMKKLYGRSPSNTLDPATTDLFASLALEDREQVNTSNGTLDKSARTWQDWADLFASIAMWMEEYETCRVRNGLAREIDREERKSKGVSSEEGHHVDSGFLEVGHVYYSSLASYQVPRCVVLDALEVENGFRRRTGIPEGLPIGPDGKEFNDYRWARSKLSPGHLATPLLLASNSLSYFFGQLAGSDWTYNSSWELDYLEMCVFHSDIISTRFPSPSTSLVPYEQIYQPSKEDEEGTKRAKTCPYPRGSAWNVEEWQQWLTEVQSGMILVPAVSWQAWWTLIAVLNGADGSGRSVDLQVKAAEEPFSALDDLTSIYI